MEQVTPHALGNHLLKAVQMLLQSHELWAMLTGAPLDGPRTFRLVPSDQPPAIPLQTHEAPSPSAAEATLRALQALRERVAARLTAQRHDPTFALHRHIVEEC